MLNVKKLRGKIVENGYTQRQLAAAIGVSNRTFTSRMHRKIFGSDEIEKIAKLFSLTPKEVLEIFFADDVSY